MNDLPALPQGSLGAFNGVEIQYDPASDGMVNATQMCKATGKLWGHYWSNQQTQEFVEALSGAIGIPIALLVQSNASGPYESRGTWVHRRVAIHLAQWCSPAFAVWVTEKIEQLMTTGRVIIPREHQEAEIERVGSQAVIDRLDKLVTRVEQSNDLTRHAVICYEHTMKALQQAKPERVERRVQEMLAKDEGGQLSVKVPTGEIDVVTQGEIIEVKHWRDYKHAIGQVLMYSPHAIAMYGRPLGKRIHLFSKPYTDLPTDRQKAAIERESREAGVRVTWHDWASLALPQQSQGMFSFSYQLS